MNLTSIYLLAFGLLFTIQTGCKETNQKYNDELQAQSIKWAEEDFSRGLRRYYMNKGYDRFTNYIVFKELGIVLETISPDFFYNYTYLYRINELTLQSLNLDSLELDSIIEEFDNRIDSINEPLEIPRYHDGAYCYRLPDIKFPTLKDGYNWQDIYLDSCPESPGISSFAYWYVINGKGEVTQIEIESGPTTDQINKLTRCLTSFKYNPATYNDSIILFRTGSIINIDCLKECNE